MCLLCIPLVAFSRNNDHCFPMYSVCKVQLEYKPWRRKLNCINKLILMIKKVCIVVVEFQECGGRLQFRMDALCGISVFLIP